MSDTIEISVDESPVNWMRNEDGETVMPASEAKKRGYETDSEPIPQEERKND